MGLLPTFEKGFQLGAWGSILLLPTPHQSINVQSGPLSGPCLCQPDALSPKGLVLTMEKCPVVIGPVEQLPFGERETILPLVYSWSSGYPRSLVTSSSLCIPLNFVPLTIVGLQILSTEFSGSSDVDRGD